MEHLPDSTDQYQDFQMVLNLENFFVYEPVRTVHVLLACPLDNTHPPKGSTPADEDYKALTTFA